VLLRRQYARHLIFRYKSDDKETRQRQLNIARRKINNMAK
jgi:hypothetical protein